MRTLRFSIHANVVDSYIYGGYLFLVLEDGNLGYIPMSRIMHKLKDKYPQFQSLLKLAFERNDYFGNDTGRTYLGISEVIVTLRKLWSFASEKMDFSLDFADIEDNFSIIDKIPSFPLLDIKMYAMTMFLGCKNGLFASHLNIQDDNYSINPGHLHKKFDAKVIGLNACCGSVVVSAGQDGLFFGPFDMDEGIIIDEHPVENISYRTSWSATDIVNYKSSSYFDYLSNQVEKYDNKPHFSKFDERTERKRIVKLNERKFDLNELLSAKQFSEDNIIYAFNGSESSFVLTKEGFYNMNFVKVDDGIHLSSRVTELSLFGKKRKIEKPMSASVVPAGCVIEFFDSVVVVRNKKVLELEKEPAYSVRSYMNSVRYRNLVSIVMQDKVSIHSLDPFSTYNFVTEKNAKMFQSKEYNKFKSFGQEELPF